MIKLILECTRLPTVQIEIADKLIPHTLYRDEYNNVAVDVNFNLKTLTEIKLIIVDMRKNTSVGLTEIIADDIRFGLVTFLCTTISNTQNTQLNNPGVIDITIGAPVWKFWCDKMNQFNYEEYPLGSLAY
jgi:hypothetical protein